MGSFINNCEYADCLLQKNYDSEDFQTRAFDKSFVV